MVGWASLPVDKRVTNDKGIGTKTSPPTTYPNSKGSKDPSYGLDHATELSVPVQLRVSGGCDSLTRQSRELTRKQISSRSLPGAREG